MLAYNSCIAGDGCSLGIRAGYALVSHLGQGGRKVALSGDSMLFTTGHGCSNCSTKDA